MKKKQAGFFSIEMVMIIVIVILLAGVGYLYLQRTSKKTTNNQAQTTTTPTGTTSSIDSLTSQDASSEATIDANHTTSETTQAQSPNTATANIGGAYSETSL